MTHVKALQAGHSSQGTSEPITPALIQDLALNVQCTPGAISRLALFQNQVLHVFRAMTVISHLANFCVDWGQLWRDMNSWRLDKWIWAMFEPTSIWPNFTFGQFIMWTGVNNYHIWLQRGLMNDFDQFSNWLRLDLISFCGQCYICIGANNEQIWLPRWYMSDFEQCSNQLKLDLISLLVNFL